MVSLVGKCSGSQDGEQTDDVFPSKALQFAHVYLGAAWNVSLRGVDLGHLLEHMRQSRNSFIC